LSRRHLAFIIAGFSKELSSGPASKQQATNMVPQCLCGRNLEPPVPYYLNGSEIRGFLP
jgi:hypothetical protein